MLKDSLQRRSPIIVDDSFDPGDAAGLDFANDHSDGHLAKADLPTASLLSMSGKGLQPIEGIFFTFRDSITQFRH